MRILALFFLSVTVVFHLPVVAEERAEVMMMGTFHFSNPGLDVVKTRQIDVTTPENQAYLQQFGQRVADMFTPTAELLECPRDSQERLNAEYREYIAGKLALPPNENYQLGFRIGKAAHLKQINCYDEQEIQWNAAKLMQTMPSEAPAIKAEFDALIADVAAEMEKMHTNLSLQEMLSALNSEALDAKNQYLYVLLNEVGAEQSFVGADATASWWHRNFRMYANIQKLAQPGSKVFVIGGQGHTAVLKGLLKLDTKRTFADVNGLL